MQRLISWIKWTADASAGLRCKSLFLRLRQSSFEGCVQFHRVFQITFSGLARVAGAAFTTIRLRIKQQSRIILTMHMHDYAYMYLAYLNLKLEVGIRSFSA